MANAPRPPVNKWLVTISVTFGTLMGAIDSSIVNVAIEHIRGSVGATLEEITWISTGFVIATVMVMPLTAFLGRLLGQKRVYMFCLMLFVAGSVLCGMARSLNTLILFRFIQGLGAGALQPTEQAILRNTFPPKEQAMAMALFGMAVMLGPAVGPTLGGYAAALACPAISYPPQPNTPAASTMPGTARRHGKAIGAGTRASSSIRSITEATKPEAGISSSSPARIRSIGLADISIPSPGFVFILKPPLPFRVRPDRAAPSLPSDAENGS